MMTAAYELSVEVASSQCSFDAVWFGFSVQCFTTGNVLNGVSEI